MSSSLTDADGTSEYSAYSEEDVSTVCDKLRLAWTGDYLSLKRYVSENLKINGVWSQPGGDKKVFRSDFFSISWWKNKKVFCEEASKIKRVFCLEIDDIARSEAVSKKTLAVDNSIRSPCSCRCSELLTDVEGIKLDQVISERETQSNTHSIMEINDVLIKLQADFDELRRQIDNFKEKTTNSLQNYAKQIPSFEYSNSEQQGIPNGNNQKSPNDNCVNNQLSAEINNHNEIHLPVN